MVIVQQLRRVLPPGYVAKPRVHSGSQVEIDVATFEKDELPVPPAAADHGATGGAATAVWAPPKPSFAIETDLPDYDEYEVRIYDTRRARQLVAAIEIVSPANKDRPEHRNIFVAKCAALLQKGVAVSIIDLVTTRQFNLYSELLSFIEITDPTLGDPPPHLYAAAARWTRRARKTILEAWSHELKIGQPLPILPLWLSHTLSIPLHLETSYEHACNDLWIP
jgi:hypothetical protein